MGSAETFRPGHRGIHPTTGHEVIVAAERDRYRDALAEIQGLCRQEAERVGGPRWSWITEEFARANARMESLPPHARPLATGRTFGQGNTETEG